MSPAHSLAAVRRQLAVLLGVTALATLVLLGYLIWSGREEAISAARTTTRNYAAILEARLDATLRRIDADLLEQADLLPAAALREQAVPRYARELNAILKSRLVNFGELGGLRVFDASGASLYAADAQTARLSNIADRGYFQLLRDNPRAGLVFSEVVVTRPRARQSVVTARALRDAQGAFRGVVAATINLDHFQTLFQSLDLGDRGLVAIRRSDDFTQIVRWPPLESETNKPLPPDNPMRAAISAGKTQATAEYAASSDGVVRIFSVRRLERFPFYVVAALGRDDVLAGWRVRSLAVGGAGLLLLGLLAALLFRLRRSETRQARVMADLAESEERAQMTLDTSMDAVIGMNSSGTVTGWSAGAKRIFGYDRGETLGKMLSGLIIPAEHRDAHDRGLKRFLETGQGPAIGRRIELTAMRADGSAFPVELTIAHARRDGDHHFSAFVRDITERKRAEDALRASEEKFSKAFRASPDWIALSKVATGEFLEVNEGFERISGYSREEVIGRTSIELGIWAQPNRRAELMGRIASGGALRDVDAVFRRKDGEERMVLLSMEAIDLSGEKCMLAVARDVTEQRQAERERAALELQLRQSQKMEAVGTLAGGIAHDFNNIVGAILGNAELARQDVGAGHPALESITEINKAGRRARDLVQQILAFSRKQAFSRSVIALGTMVEEAVKLLQATLPAGVRLAAACAPDAPSVLADPTQIHQVLVNLCTNAWHAMAGRPGNIDIRLEEVAMDAALAREHAGLRPDRYVRLTVSDTGKGMDAATKERIFEPFFTTKPVGMGTGLGLSVVHGIVQGHGGAITVESAPGTGTTFQLYFPAAGPAPR